MKSDFNRLVDKAPPEIKLGDAPMPDAIRTKTGLEPKQAGSVSSEQVTVQSTDGLFAFIVRIVKA